MEVSGNGGSFPWEENPDVAHICCPDHLNRTVYKIERMEEVAFKEKSNGDLKGVNRS